MGIHGEQTIAFCPLQGRQPTHKEGGVFLLGGEWLFSTKSNLSFVGAMEAKRLRHT